MRKLFCLFVMLLTMIATTYAQSTDEAVKNVAETAKTINQTVKVLTPDTLFVVQSDVEKVKVEEEIPDSAKISAKEIYTDFKSGLTGMAKALKVGVEHVYTVIIKQQIVKSVMWLFLFILGIILLVMYKPLYTFGSKNSYDSDGASYIPLALQITIGVVLIFLFLGHVDDVFTGFINPEYGAMKDIIEFVGELRTPASN